LIYLGYGALGGCGLGLGYVSPVSTLIRWFPDRRGLATGLAIMGFGGGAMIGAPVKEALLKAFFKAPEYIGAESDVTMKTEEGKRFVQVDGDWKEAVLATSSDIAKLPDPNLREGAYLVGTGNTGAAGTFMTLGVVYFLVMMVASFSYRVPAADWRPDGWEPPTDTESSKRMITTGNVDMDQALKTPQFYFLWIVLCFNVTAGIGVIGVAKTMMNEIFGTTLPSVVNGAFAATYVLMISVFNMLGRIIWASASDYICR